MECSPLLSGAIRSLIKEMFEDSEAWWYMSIIPAMWEAQIGGSWSSPPQAKKHKTLSKRLPKQKRAGI
jgi:hypothetical protein